jgi:tmRNA-binding protein
MQDQSHIVTWVPAEEDLDESGMKVMNMMGPKKKKNDERESERERERERERETWLLLLLGL